MKFGRARAALTLAATLLLSLIFVSAFGQPSSGGQVALSGQFTSVVVCTFGQGASEEIADYLMAESGKRYRIHLPPGMQKPTTGDEVRVSGRVQGNDLYVRTLTNMGNDGPGNPSMGEQRWIVLLCNFQDNTTENVSVSQVYSTFFDPNDSTDVWWRQASFNKMWITGEVHGWYTLPVNVGCDPWTWHDLAIQAADPDVDFSQFDRLYILVPDGGGCGWGGLGTLGKFTTNTDDGPFYHSSSWGRSEYYNSLTLAIQLTTHEGGHNHGLLHAHSVAFPGEPIGPFNTNGAGASVTEYGDAFSSMGAWNWGSYSPPQKIALNWFNTNNVKTVTTSGVYVVDGYLTNSFVPKVLKVFRGHAASTNQDEWLYFHQRLPQGYDANLNYYGGYNFGAALCHYEWRQNNITGSNLVDFTYADGDVRNGALRPGEVWTDPYTELSIKPLYTIGDDLYILVSFGPLVSVTADPTVVTGGTRIQGTVQLNRPAGKDGELVSVSSSDPSSASVPATVLVPEGEMSAPFWIYTANVVNVTEVTITVELDSIEDSVEITIIPLAVTGVTVDPGTVTGGRTATGRVTLDGPAAFGGSSVSLSSQKPWRAQVPPSVTVNEGETSATFTITTTPTQATESVKIFATFNGVLKFATLYVATPVVEGIKLNPSKVQGGSPSTAIVILSGPAPAGGTVVTMSSSNTSVASVPMSVTVQPGDQQIVVPITTYTVTATRLVSIRASRFITRSAPLTVTP